MGIRSNWLAYQFDEAVFLWGRHVETELEKCKSNIERERKIHQLLEKEWKPTPIDAVMLRGMRGIRVKGKSRA